MTEALRRKLTNAGRVLTSQDQGDFVAGQVGATYTITVHNAGPADTDSGETITVTDNLPSDLTITGLSGTGWNCTPPSSLTCTSTTTIANGANAQPITVTVNVAANPTSSQVTNQASVSAADDTHPHSVAFWAWLRHEARVWQALGCVYWRVPA